MGTKALIFEIIGIDKASATFGKVSTAVAGTTTNMERMQKAGAIAGKALAIGAAGAAVGLFYAGKAAADDEAAQAQLAQQLKQAAHATDGQIASTEAWITAQGKATGISDDELRPALARLATATGSVSQAQKLAALAMDVSAGSGKSYQQVTEALAKAQNGNIGALGRLGIATKDADGKTKSLAQITDDLATKYKGAAAAAAETTAGKQKILTTQLHELAEQIGTAVLPAMVKFAEIMIKLVGFISDHTKAVGIAIGALAGLLAITAAVGAATQAWAAIQAVVRAATLAWTAGQWLLNAALTANPIGLVIVAVAALVAAIILAYKHSETFRNIVNAAFGAVAKAAGVAVDFIRDHWRLLLAILTGPIGIAIGIISKHWDTIRAGAAVVVGWIREHWPAIRDALVTPIQRAKDAISNVWDNIKDGFGAVKDKIGDVAGRIRDAISGAFNAAKSAVDGVINAIQSLIDKVQSAIDKIKSIPHPDINPFNRSTTGSVGSAVIGGGKDAIAAAAGVTGLAGRRGAGANGGGDVYNITVNALDGTDAAKHVVQTIKRYKREVNGGRELGIA